VDAHALRYERTRLEAGYWLRPPGWTRAGDILHKHAVAKRLKVVNALLDPLVLLAHEGLQQQGEKSAGTGSTDRP
jgi:hypothetical protein